MMRSDPKIGEVAFAFDLRGPYGFDTVLGRVYANFGLVRTDVGAEIAQAQGDPSGRRWWNPIYHTYGADCEFACWLYKLGYTIAARQDIQVHDKNHKDALRQKNGERAQADGRLFWRRWTSLETLTRGPNP
jgi:hypothetical protein